MYVYLLYYFEEANSPLLGVYRSKKAIDKAIETRSRRELRTFGYNKHKVRM